MFAWLLLIGAALAIAAKLQAPDIGAGASAFSVFETIVVISLGCLGAPVSIGEIEIAVVPLGVLLAFGLVVVRVVRTRENSGFGDMPTSSRQSDGARLARGMAVVPFFAAICALAAAIFRLGGEAPVHASPAYAAVWGAVWCALFAGVGMAPRTTGAGKLFNDLSAEGAGDRSLSAPAVSLVACTAAGFVLAAGAAALGLLVKIADSIGDGAAAAAGALLHDLAFFPNLTVAVSALAVGAPVEAGSALTLGGEVKPLPEYSLWDWAGGPTPVLAFFLLAIPVIAGVAAGAAARRASRSRAQAAAATLLAAAGFGALHATLAWLADARLAAGTIGEEGFARVAPAPTSGGLALLWVAVIGVASVAVTDRLGTSHRRRSNQRTNDSHTETGGRR